MILERCFPVRASSKERVYWQTCHREESLLLTQLVKVVRHYCRPPEMYTTLKVRRAGAQTLDTCCLRGSNGVLRILARVGRVYLLYARSGPPSDWYLDTAFLKHTMQISFASKRVMVTGAGQGIGRDLVKKLLDCGAEVVAVSRTKKHLDSLKEEVKDKPLLIICADLSDWSAAQSAAREAGPVDCLVNNAAVAILSPLLEVKPEDFDTSFNCNVKSVIAVSQVVARGMIARKKGGSIVNVSSQASQAALASHTVYCGTKGAVDMVSKVMALELGPHNIRVNTINPTVVMTAMGKIGWSKPETADPMLAKIPLHRFAEVEEVVDAILFLLSDKASMINGVTLPIDGGFLAC